MNICLSRSCENDWIFLLSILNVLSNMAFKPGCSVGHPQICELRDLHLNLGQTYLSSLHQFFVTKTLMNMPSSPTSKHFPWKKTHLPPKQVLQQKVIHIFVGSYGFHSHQVRWYARVGKRQVKSQGFWCRRRGNLFVTSNGWLGMLMWQKGPIPSYKPYKPYKMPTKNTHTHFFWTNSAV